MAHFILFITATLVLAASQCNGVAISEVYWHTMLPKTPMPIPIRQRLSLDDMEGEPSKVYYAQKDQAFQSIDLVVNAPKLHPSNNIGVRSDYRASNNPQMDGPGVPFYFLERDLHVGKKVEVMFHRPLEGDHFLTPRTAEYLPFSSSKLPELLNLFSIHPYSAKAKQMEQVHHFCELPPFPGEKKHCATSLESMVDFIASSLDASTPDLIKTISSTTEEEMASSQIHTVVSISPQPMQGSTSIVCHLEAYPYTVYRCHTSATTQPYLIRLASQPEGNIAEAAATCHRDTSHWDVAHYALKALKVKPGEASVCHVLPLGDIAFFPASTFGGVESTVFIC